VIAGLLLAVGSALAGRVSLLLKQRGAGAAPAVCARYPVRSAVGLFHSKWGTVGWPSSGQTTPVGVVDGPVSGSGAVASGRRR
jgi:hypothetical protein